MYIERKNIFQRVKATNDARDSCWYAAHDTRSHSGCSRFALLYDKSNGVTEL